MAINDIYYISGDKKIGPCSIRDFERLELNEHTYVWYVGLNDWTQVKNIPELRIRTTKNPPPFIPKDNNQWNENSKERTENFNSVPMEPTKIQTSQRALKFLLAWSGFHFFALITSMSKMKFFNDPYANNFLKETEQFWPFVKIFQYYEQPNRWYGPIRPEVHWEYNGLFYQYDWSEFLIFVVGAIIIFLFHYISVRRKENPVANNG